MRKQVEIPVHDNTIQTLRSLDPESQANKNLFKKKSEEITDITLFNKLLKEVIIRFDTDPSYYQKDDFKKLISLIARSLKYFYTQNSSEELEIINQKIELLKQKLLEFGTISKEQIDSLFEDLETEVPYPTKTKKYTEEVIFDFAYWQKPGAKPGTKVLMTKARIPDAKGGYGAIWGKFFVNKPENFLVTVGTLYKVDDTDEYIGQIENITGTLRILQCFKTTYTERESAFNTCYWNDNIVDNKLYVDNYTGVIKVKYTAPPSISFKKLNVCISVADYFGIKSLRGSKIYSLESEPNSYKWNLVPVNQSEYKCKYHKLKVQRDSDTLERSTWRIYNRASINSKYKKIYLCKRGRLSKKLKRLSRNNRMGWIRMQKKYNIQDNIKHRIGIRSERTKHAYIMFYEGKRYQTSNGIVYKYKYIDGILDESTGVYIKDIQPLKISY